MKNAAHTGFGATFQMFTAAVIIAATAPGSAQSASFTVTQEDIAKAKQRFQEMYPGSDPMKPPEPADASVRALSAAEREHMLNAIKDCRTVMAQFPDNKPWCAKLQNQIGSTYTDMGEYDTAIAEYEKVLREYPSFKEACDAAQQGIERCRELAQDRREKPARRELEAAEKVVPAGAAIPTAAEASRGTPASVRAESLSGPADAGEAPAGMVHVIVLRNGRTVRGEIIKQTAKTLTVHCKDRTEVFDRSDVVSCEEAP
ncbi:MAG TPA: tetratricopeptide repeat protein [bacterium]|nr:tetratricopeptide repeat protein [bacterium]